MHARDVKLSLIVMHFITGTDNGLIILSLLYALTERVRFMHHGQTYLNNSIVAINDIGEGDNALLCVTDKLDCCKLPNGPYQGEFYYPNNTLVRNRHGRHSLYRNRGPQVVRLNRRSNTHSPTGIYKCEIPDFTGWNRSIYIIITGIYYLLLRF